MASTPSTTVVTSGRVISPAAAATVNQRMAARFQPGRNAHRPGWPVVNQPGTPPTALVPGGQERRVGAALAQRRASREPDGPDHHPGHGAGQGHRRHAPPAGVPEPGHAGVPAQGPPGQVPESRAERRQHHHGGDQLGDRMR